MTSREAADLLSYVPRQHPGLRQRSSRIPELCDESVSLLHDPEFDVPARTKYFRTRVHVLFEKQLRRCGICRIPVKLGDRSWQGADCDHLGEHVRGILCKRCNPSLRKDADERIAFLRFYNVRDQWRAYLAAPPADRLLDIRLLHRDRGRRLSETHFAGLVSRESTA